MNLNQPIKIIIADDHEIFRVGFKKIFQRKYSTKIEFIAEACNGQELIDLVAIHHPHIVISDIKMPVMDGIKACKIIKDRFPSIGVIAFSMFDDLNNVTSMLQAGANGYLVKSAPATEIMEAIQTVYRNEHYYCSSVSAIMFHEPMNSKEKKRTNKIIEFSAQEKRIMQLICNQYSTKEIAASMNLATRTIDHYRENILNKIGARNLAGIVLYSIVHEVVKLDEVKFAV
jgi:DNA-binding NarL/FixJ family response regulator